ncbi:MAG: glycosyltransferase [Thermoguttaceae bacterium]|nr:glycosyltransferase [Thermoguttaceae bacterium]
MNNPKLSISCITYNHAKYIRQALDGFVMQKTNFPFEVLIHDDASTDGTADIIREYEAKYPDIIKPIYQTENQFSKGISISKTFIFPRIQSEYMAMCEGDDYWTDPLKLQKQVDFLDAHPDYSICFHPVSVHWELSNRQHGDDIYPTPRKRFYKTTLTVNDIIKRNFIQTNSVVYRWSPETVDIFPNGILPGDWFLHLIHARHGKIGFLNDVMGVYRRHDNGIWQKDYMLKYAKQYINFYKACDVLFEYKKHALFDKRARNIVVFLFRESIKYNDFSQLSLIYPDFPNDIRTSFLKLYAKRFLKKDRLSFWDAMFNHLAILMLIRYNIKI